jgi:hypothetical protein
MHLKIIANLKLELLIELRNDTLWKAFNCITYNEDHLRGGSDNVDSRLKNNFFTNGKDNIKTKAMNTALELAVA